jgi:hypothetical protein
MTADHVAWVVLVVSTFYLLDRLMVWALSRALAAHRRRAARRAQAARARRPGNGPARQGLTDTPGRGGDR